MPDQDRLQLSAAVSVVICAYTVDRWPEIGEAVRSALGQTAGPDREVILSVDHNPTLARRAEREWRTVRIIESDGPPGLSGARNTGVAAARHPIVAFLDDDARAEHGWLDALIEPFADASTVGTGGIAEPVWQTGQPRWFPDEFLWVVGCSYRGLPRDAAEEFRNPLGCNMAFRRAAVLEAGGFREEVGRVGRHPTGGEETELSIRVRRREPGARILHVPQARVRHRVPAERATLRYFVARCYQEGRSKALISEMAGAGAALASERRYVARTLPFGMARHGARILRGDVFGPVRAAVIAIGALVTAAGYARGRVAIARGGDAARPRSAGSRLSRSG